MTNKPIKLHNTAGCYLVRKNPSTHEWEIILIYKKWAENDQGWVPPKGHVEKGVLRKVKEILTN